MPSPNPAPGTGVLQGVAGTASNDVWAVGSYVSGTYWQTLTEHWNGVDDRARAKERVTTPRWDQRTPRGCTYGKGLLPNRTSGRIMRPYPGLEAGGPGVV